MLLPVAMSVIPMSASAHGVWFAMRCDRTQLVCGEGWKDNGYAPNELIRMNGYEASYADVNVEPVNPPMAFGDTIIVPGAANVNHGGESAPPHGTFRAMPFMFHGADGRPFFSSMYFSLPHKN